MKRHCLRYGLVLTTLASLSALGCESRQETLARELAYQYGDKKKADASTEVAAVPADPMRESLRPLLEGLYSGSALPDVLDAEILSLIHI